MMRAMLLPVGSSRRSAHRHFGRRLLLIFHGLPGIFIRLSCSLAQGCLMMSLAIQLLLAHFVSLLGLQLGQEAALVFLVLTLDAP